MSKKNNHKINDKKSKIKNERKNNSSENNQPEITTFYEFYEIHEPPVLMQCPYCTETEASIPLINMYHIQPNSSFCTHCNSNHYWINEVCDSDFCRNTAEPIIEEPDSEDEYSPEINIPPSISTPDIRNKK